MSAADAVDGAHSAASKCHRMVASKPERFKEVRPGNDDGVPKFWRNWRGHDDVMQTRLIRGSGEPVWVNASSNACFRLGPDPRRALWPAASVPHSGSQMPSTMTTSNSLALSCLRCAAASRYSGDSWQEIAFSKLGNSMTMKRWNFSGPSRILNLPPRARILPPNFRRMPGTRSVYFLY